MFRCCFKSVITILHKHETVTIACALLSSEVPVGHLWRCRLLSTFKRHNTFQTVTGDRVFTSSLYFRNYLAVTEHEVGEVFLMLIQHKEIPL